MVRIAEPGETALSVSLHPSSSAFFFLSHTPKLFQTLLSLFEFVVELLLSLLVGEIEGNRDV